ncbi:magnesium transporter CorA family protein [Leucobacter massiliensis]|uniref:Magnesium transporter n=1 Tax=Leucobacter massiliensis TaxID=1686285 RepID=A0A2S9QQ76_9MICO|nr:magnesium transporter CorA family protein [Leucobacter massiliensis]PRI11734.1 magnesium transporter [Leucobacter massiliensis]
MGSVSSLVWDGRGAVISRNVPFAEISELLRRDDVLSWVDLSGAEPQDLERLAGELGLDPMAVEDAVAHVERPKALRYATHTFFTVYSADFDASGLGNGAGGGSADEGSLAARIRLHKISAFVFPRGLITVRAPEFDVEALVQRWEDNADLLGSGVGALVHGLLDVVVDGHFEAVQSLDDTVEGIEDVLFDERVLARRVQRDTYRLRKELVRLRRIVLPMREVVNGVLRHHREAGSSPELDASYDDLYDHVLRVTEWTESLRDMVTAIFETNLSLQDARLNTVMKKLTGWAAIIAVPTAVTGFFGQNVPYPGYGTWWGFVASVVVMVGAGAALYIAFKRKEWI